MIMVDVTPTWQGILPLLIELLQNGNDAGQRTAREELAKMAKAADLYNEEQR